MRWLQKHWLALSVLGVLVLIVMARIGTPSWSSMRPLYRRLADARLRHRLAALKADENERREVEALHAEMQEAEERAGHVAADNLKTWGESPAALTEALRDRLRMLKEEM